MYDIPKEVIEQARDSLDALLYWAEDSEDIPKEIYDEAEKILKELEKYIPFESPIEIGLRLIENQVPVCPATRLGNLLTKKQVSENKNSA